MSFPSESDMMSKELQNSDLIYMNLRTDVFKIIVKYRRKIISKYCHLLPSGNRALQNQSKNNYISNYGNYVLVTIGKILVANQC